jgi:hypothetical protein
MAMLQNSRKNMPTTSVGMAPNTPVFSAPGAVKPGMVLA